MFNRIVSFLPSATEIIYLLESQDLLFGVTHQCVCPTEAKSKPQIISSSFDSESMTSFQIEEKIQELSRMQNDVFIINFDLLKKIQPDLIISQALCDVCSPHNKELDKTMKFLDYKPQTLVLDPHNVEEIIESIMIIARAVGKEEDGLRIKDSLYKRIEKISNATKFKKPKVICLEWIDPIYICGHWVPQMVGIVGAINGISKVGERSSKIDFSQITQFDPDIIILLPCGLDLSKVFQECSYLQTNKQWQSLRAVQNGMVFAVDALSYFSRPGPSIITGIEILAKIINPESFPQLIVPSNSYNRMKKEPN
ncbi:MAG TPA: ABC transporter substrate-binding protein [Nitrososphaeraceae archaeon]|nr:ABC transporter substrate-binding protein [Nitrososphaeraceae archaeon]